MDRLRSDAAVGSCLVGLAVLEGQVSKPVGDFWLFFLLHSFTSIGLLGCLDSGLEAGVVVPVNVGGSVLGVGAGAVLLVVEPVVALRQPGP